MKNNLEEKSYTAYGYGSGNEMKLKTYTYLAVLIVSFALLILNAGNSRASEILLNDGTKIQGTITKMNDTSISVSTSYGLVTIPKDKIANINLNDAGQNLIGKQVIISLKDGTTIEGKLLKQTSSYLIMQASFGQLTVKRKNVVSIKEANTTTEDNTNENGEENTGSNTTNYAEPAQPTNNTNQYNSNYPVQNRHTGLYLGAGLGVENPTGPDQPHSSMGVGWVFKIGYQFLRGLAIELGYDEGVGGISYNGVTGGWTFIELPYFDIKPIIPLSASNNLYFLLGATYASLTAVTTNPATSSTLGPDIGANLGIGYEGYIGSHFSIGLEVVYHYLASTNYSFTANGQTKTGTIPYANDGSQTSANLMFLFHI